MSAPSPLVTTAGDTLHRLLATKTAAELAGDPAAVLDVYLDDPVFDFCPIGRRLAGVANGILWYEHLIHDFMPKVVGAEETYSVASESDLVKEQLLTVRLDGGTRTFRMVVLTGVRDGRLWGQRFYASEDLHALLLGDLLDAAEEMSS